jgi:hypothetical protein
MYLRRREIDSLVQILVTCRFQHRLTINVTQVKDIVDFD